MEIFNESTDTLKQNWEELKSDFPQLRIRDAAKRLGVSEAELLATGIGENVIRLQDNFKSQVLDFPKLGKVMSLTRNEACVLEHKGPFQKIELHAAGPSTIATVIGPIEQRVFFKSWKFGFAVTTQSPRGILKSLQYFDQTGEAILKVYLQEKSNPEAYELMVEKYASENQHIPLSIEMPEKPIYSSLDELDMEEFQSDWANMKDTHDFFGMLRKHKLNRLDAVKWIGDRWAYEVSKSSVRKVLSVASETQLPIMIFAGNKGNIQIHQGKVRTIRQMGDWINVLDPDFNMHLNESEVDSAYVVHKNTTDGYVSALELFDKNGEMVAQFFGLRKPGLPQKPAWKELLDQLT
ncbi:hemin-degrading factor [Algoriphagus lutimaris]|uniref:hemin-degrading factor n=1 Tax=Algoriphagus lutimaris TaxID=613197 RepID=UPI00196B8657|nr:ChuX/HutX family heme-like substrate-binding protein [Algoriphagus lutimaris]MBN3518799.1 hemin-degrading factor [Algoriphagus lutimaris]